MDRLALALHERSILGAIEHHEMFGEHDLARDLKKKYLSDKKRIHQQKENKMMIQKNQIFEGKLVAAGWDRLDHVNQSSLYTQDDEDILLEHHLGIRKFKPYLNQKVRITGDIISTIRDGRRVLVKKISRLTDGFKKPIIPLRDEFDNLLIPAAA
jgi:hypothetical protein